VRRISETRPLRLPKMTQDEIEELIEGQAICRIAFKGGEYPYLAPFQYALRDGAVYFHFTNYGRKIKLLKQNSRVCVGFERIEPDLSEYRFVVLSGSLKLVDDSEERARVIEKMAEDGKSSYSENLLAAHGFSKERGWSALRPNSPMVIVKLVDVTSTIGLKSPY
jgi:nitroimidazol reductase NimA-like FMN-containing flavoprotein (pyridoxamine 5'-phosphate oxidase superfamily)